MGVIENAFEIERRQITWSNMTTLNDGVTSLGFDGDPNTITNGTSGTDGENWLYNLPIGQFYKESNATLWWKSAAPNTWIEQGGGGGGGGTWGSITGTLSAQTDLQTALDAKVGDTGDETVAGVKTFSESPVVPEPTTDMQTATKKYVDDNGGESVSFDGVYETPSGVISGTSMQEWIDAHFSSIDPSVGIQATPSFGLREIGDNVVNPSIGGRGVLGANPTGTLTVTDYFRGTTSGTNFANQTPPTPNTWHNKTDTHTVTSAQTYTVRVTDSEGRMDTASGSYSFTTPYYATTSAIATLTKQSLKTSGASYFQANMVAESGGDKQIYDHPDSFPNVTGIRFYNTVSSAWEWLGGSKATSLTLFTKTTTTHTVQGATINYDRYTHNGATVGARNLRFYTT